MVLKELNLKHFRNYSSLKIEFNPYINIIYGNNAQGKTNLLESIYVLAMTRSHRLSANNNLIKQGEEICKITGTLIENKIKTRMEIYLEEKNKTLKIDGNEIKKVSDYIYSKLDIIIFYPEDLELIKGSPNIRRNFLNLELSQISNNYLSILTDYNKLLKIRNDNLKKKAKGLTIDEDYFYIITNYLIDKSILITKMRQKFINEINQTCSEIFEDVTKLSDFKIKYLNSIEIISDDLELTKNKLIEKYQKNHRRELKFGSTLYGPHRDDLEFYLDVKNLKEFGSQGQQRIAVLSTKLAEIEVFKKYKGQNPILLLDDVFSELDDIKKNNLVKYLNQNIQVIITTTDLKKINKKSFNNARIFKIKEGEVIKLEEVETNE